MKKKSLKNIRNGIRWEGTKVIYFNGKKSLFYNVQHDGKNKRKLNFLIAYYMCSISTDFKHQCRRFLCRYLHYTSILEIGYTQKNLIYGIPNIWSKSHVQLCSFTKQISWVHNSWPWTKRHKEKTGRGMKNNLPFVLSKWILIS